MNLELLLKREPTLLDRVTLGDLYEMDFVNETTHWLCHTLEDAVREVKIRGKTAIPAGKYRIVAEDSPRFGPDTLTLLNVPNYDYVRIHGGNTEEDTDGCPLVGAQRAGAAIHDCATALRALKALVLPVLRAGGEVWLTIRNHDAGTESKP